MSLALSADVEPWVERDEPETFFAEAQRAYARAICHALGVPPHMILPTRQSAMDTKTETPRPCRRVKARAPLIVRASALQSLQCSICEQVVEYSRATAADPEAMAMLVERTTDDHQDCLQWSHDPARAKRERGVKLRMRREFRKRQCSRRLF